MGSILAAMPVAHATAAATELIWENTQVALAGVEGQPVVTGVFKFQNRSHRVVRFLAITPSCDCTSAKADQPLYQPGATGKIVATYSIGQRSGSREATIEVIPDSTPSEAIRLTLQIEIPEVVSISPRVISWQTGGALDAKAVAISLRSGSALSFGPIRVSDPRIVATLEQLGSAGEWRLWLKPTQTEKPMHGVVMVQALVDGRMYLEAVHALVK